MEDSHNWQTALLTMEWGDDLKRLQNWVTGRTFAPHWREFVSTWLQSPIRDATRVPTLTQILNRCMDSWLSNTNSYYLSRPDMTSWHEHCGLGYHVRLLTMIVRENMASNGIWEIVSGKFVKRYFEKALIIANCMQEDWAQKGPVYRHFQSSRSTANSQNQPRGETTRTASLANGHKPASSSSKDISTGSAQAQSTIAGSNHHDINDKDQTKTPKKQAGDIRKPDQSQANDKTHAKPGNQVSESELDKPRDFLKSLEEDLDRDREQKELEFKRKAVEKSRLARKDTEPGEITEYTTPVKRAAPDDQVGMLKKRKSDEVKTENSELPRGLSSLLSAERRPISGPVKMSEAQAKMNGETDGSVHIWDLLIILTLFRVKLDSPAQTNGTKDRESPIALRAPLSPNDTYRRPRNSSLNDKPQARLPSITTSPTTLYRNNSFSTSSRGPHYSRASSPAYHTPDTPFSSREDRTFSYPPSSKLGSHSITNRITDNMHIRGSGKSTRSTEDVLLDTCVYELKNQPCPTKGGCRKKPVCVVGIPISLSVPMFRNSLSFYSRDICSYFVFCQELSFC